MGVELFEHKCITEDCNRIVQYDDEPWCVEHSPDSGSHLPGYSARRAMNERLELQAQDIKNQRREETKRNVFKDD